MQGTRLSVRRRQVTMQTAHEAPVGAVTAPLSSAVFDEPPDPNALTDISTTVALLPSECGYPTDPFAGAGDVQVQGLSNAGARWPAGRGGVSGWTTVCTWAAVRRAWAAAQPVPAQCRTYSPGCRPPLPAPLPRRTSPHT